MKAAAVSYDAQPAILSTGSQAVPQEKSTWEGRAFHLLSGKAFEGEAEPPMEYLVYDLLETVAVLCEEESNDFHALEFLLEDLKEVAPENQSAVLKAAAERAKEHPALADFLSRKQIKLLDAPFKSSKQLGLALEEQEEADKEFYPFLKNVMIGLGVVVVALSIFGNLKSRSSEGEKAADDASAKPQKPPSTIEDYFKNLDQQTAQREAQNKIDRENHESTMRLLKDGLNPQKVQQLEARASQAASIGANLRAKYPNMF